MDQFRSKPHFAAGNVKKLGAVQLLLCPNVSGNAKNSPLLESKIVIFSYHPTKRGEYEITIRQGD